MTDSKSFFLSPEVQHYMSGHSTAPDAVARSLVERTAALGDVSIMQIAPEQGLFITLLTQTLGARFAVEVGTFTGFSALAIARGLAPGGRLLCCDTSVEWTDIAREHWAKAGVDDRIDLRIAPAAETLGALAPEPVIDLAFIDADKPGYVTYWEEIVPRMRPGGLVLVDNVLLFGSVIDASNTSENAVAIRRFNDHAAADDRVELVMLAIADGLTIARKR